MRVTRVSALAGSCAAVTVGGHVLAQGHSGALGLILVLVLMAASAAFVTSREMSTVAIFGFAAASQFIGHLMMSFFGTHQLASTGLASNSIAPALDHTHAAHLLSGPGANLAQWQMSLPMVVAHLVACLLVAAVLRSGEKTAFALHTVVRAVLRTLVGPGPSKADGRIVDANHGTLEPGYQAPDVAWQLILGPSVIRRGPPALISVY